MTRWQEDERLRTPCADSSDHGGVPLRPLGRRGRPGLPRGWGMLERCEPRPEWGVSSEQEVPPVGPPALASRTRGACQPRAPHPAHLAVGVADPRRGCALRKD